MAISARLLRSLLPVLLSSGLVVAACSSDSDGPADPGQVDDPKPDGGADSGSGSSGGAAGAPDDDPGMGEAGTPPVATGGTGEEPGTGGMPSEPVGGSGMAGADNEPTGPTEGFLRGEALVEMSECKTCHQADFGGLALFANITPDEVTGIGTWTDEDISNAVRNGVGKDGSKLCLQMMKYPFSDEQMADVIEFLRGIPAVSRVTSECQ